MTDAMTEGTGLKSGDDRGVGGNASHGLGNTLTIGLGDSAGATEGLGNAFNAYDEGAEGDLGSTSYSLGFLDEDRAHGGHEAMMSVAVGDATCSTKAMMAHAVGDVKATQAGGDAKGRKNIGGALAEL
ncbi:unnamed protein product [Ilex paraguariensis]|uniref:Uncharacterized protein n=1 Tax=Ilex paraguariensis TaxID=185542 RepID=A0ABC8T4T9_9AQUA